MTQDNWTENTPGGFASWTATGDPPWSTGSPPTPTEDAYLDSTAFADVAVPVNETVNSIAANSNDILDIANDIDFTAAAGTGPNVNEGEIFVGNGILTINNGTFDNGSTGFIELEPDSVSGALGELLILRSLTLTGSGALEMQIGGAPTSNEIIGLSEITTPNFINQTETISGTGTIGSDLNFTNDWIVETNNSTSSNPGFLNILASGEGGSFTNNGTVQADNGGTVEFGADGKSAIVDNEKLIAVDGDGSSTFLQIAGNVTVNAATDGAGFISLQGSIPSDDYIGSDGKAATLTLNGQSVQGAGHIGDVDLTLTNALGSLIDADDSGQFLVLYTGTNTINNSGILTASGGGVLSIDSVLNNSNTIDVLAGSAVNIAAAVFGTGLIDINSNGTVEQLAGTTSENVNFAGSGGLFELSASASFTADIVGMAAGDRIEIPGSFTAGEHAVWQQTSSSGGTLSLYSKGVDLYTLNLMGSYNSLDFVVSSGGLGEALVTAQNTPNYPKNPGFNNDEWILSDGNWVESAGPGSHPGDYNVAGTGDWTGNGTDGILWFNPATGDTDEWQMSNTQWAASVDLGPHPVNSDGNSYQIAGTDASTDFFGNGIDDVLWTSTNSNGTIATDIWELNTSGAWTPTPGGSSPGPHPAGYSVVGTGDWTGAGTDGILWFDSSTGDTDEWQLSNGAYAGHVDLGTHPTNTTDNNAYQIAGVGDFFDNGIGDVLWTSVNADGTVATDIWELNSSGQWMASVSPGNHPAGYSAVGVADFAGTGTSDILWQNSATGDIDEWLISNGAYAGHVDLGAHPGNTPVSGVGDFTGTGTSDILFHS